MDRTGGYAVGKNKKPVNPQHSTVTVSSLHVYLHICSYSPNELQVCLLQRISLFLCCVRKSIICSVIGEPHSYWVLRLVYYAMFSHITISKSNLQYLENTAAPLVAKFCT